MAGEKSKGQPTKYNKAVQKIADAYLENYKEEYGHAVPSVAGLAVILKVCRRTIYNWAEDPKNTDFLHTLDRVATNQEFKLLNGGLLGDFNPSITKLALYNHGYSEKQEIVTDEDSPPTEIHFHVKEAVADIKTTNAKS